MGVGAGLYMYDVVVKTFPFASSSTDEFLWTNALNHLLPSSRNNICLRARGHSYQFPEYSTNLHVTRCLYSFV